jgi:DNA processing protein
MAVPGPVTSAMSEGCHALLRRDPDPAVLVTGVRDVLEAVGFLSAAGQLDGAEPDIGGGHATDKQRADGARRAAIDSLDHTARRVFEALAPGSFASPESLSVRAGVPVLEVVRAIPVLTLSGLVETANGEYRLSALPKG